MSNKLIKDIEQMHKKVGTRKWVENNPDKLSDFLKFRVSLLQEEMRESIQALESDNNEEFVDAMVDIVVVALGNLHIFGVDTQKAWDEVNRANLSKEIGIKESRPNPLGLPDMIKPTGWQGPDHSGNTGVLNTFKKNFKPARYAISVLNDCAELMIKKGKDYNVLPQTTYYPNGLPDLWYMLHVKITRIRSLLAKKGESNYESMADSAKDLINYSAFFVEYLEGKMDGQHENR
jgi:predicted HAD superfamily Cof-like phosphohydrolase